MTKRHRPGRGSQLTPDERREIQEMSLVQGLSQAEIARQTGRDRGTVATLLKDEDSLELRRKLQSEQHEEALLLLKNGRVAAASGWVSSIDVAAKKGDHKPARDLLLHTSVIAPVVTDRGPQVTVQVALHGGGIPVIDNEELRRISLTKLINPVANPSAESGPDGMPGGRQGEPKKGPTSPALIDTQNFSISKSSGASADAQPLRDKKDE